MREGPGDLQGFATPAAANLDHENDEAAAAGPGELRVATTFALVGIVCCTAWGGIGPGVGFPSACDGADAGGVDGQLLAMIQAEPVGDYLEAAAIGERAMWPPASRQTRATATSRAGPRAARWPEVGQAAQHSPRDRGAGHNGSGVERRVRVGVACGGGLHGSGRPAVVGRRMLGGK